MEIRGLTLEQIEQAVNEASEQYGGNLELSSFWAETPEGYGMVNGMPLNKRGDGWRVKFRVKSARRPGSRVSSGRFSKPKRIGSACWHAHREIFRAMFRINPDTKIKTALYYYKGSEDFEENFPSTAYGAGVVNAAPVECIGDLCNCDEGEWPEFAIEGLTPRQYAAREWIWDLYNTNEGQIKKPKRERALLAMYRGEVTA